MNKPVGFLTLCGVIAAAGLPLALRLVPPNKWYGFRTAATVSDRDVWFRVNRVAGCAFVAAASTSVSIYLEWPALASGRSFLGMLVFAAPLVLALIATTAYARRVKPQGSGLARR